MAVELQTLLEMEPMVLMDAKDQEVLIEKVHTDRVALVREVVKGQMVIIRDPIARDPVVMEAVDQQGMDQTMTIKVREVSHESLVQVEEARLLEMALGEVQLVQEATVKTETQLLTMAHHRTGREGMDPADKSCLQAYMETTGIQVEQEVMVLGTLTTMVMTLTKPIDLGSMRAQESRQTSLTKMITPEKDPGSPPSQGRVAG